MGEDFVFATRGVKSHAYGARSLPPTLRKVREAGGTHRFGSAIGRAPCLWATAFVTNDKVFERIDAFDTPNFRSTALTHRSHAFSPRRICARTGPSLHFFTFF